MEIDDNRCQSMIIDDNWWKSMTIDNNRWQLKNKFFGHRLVIDFRYQSINCYRLSSIVIDCRFYRLVRPRKILPFAPLRAPSCCVHRTPKTSFNRTYFLHGQNVWGHIVSQYFSRIRTLIFSLPARFRGKIISRVLEVFCLYWAIPMSRDGSERVSTEALTTCR